MDSWVPDLTPGVAPGALDEEEAAGGPGFRLLGPSHPAGPSLGSPGASTCWGPSGRPTSPTLGWRLDRKKPLLLSLATICRGGGGEGGREERGRERGETQG